MNVLPPDAPYSRTYEGLLGFFERVREAAAGRDCPQLASIALEVGHIDPLPVLASIYEPHEAHFYAECPSGEWALAGADAVFATTAHGPRRMRELRAFAEEVSAHSWVAGDPHAPFAGPQFYCALTFADQVSAGYPFAPASLFVPRWQVARSGGRYSAVANARIEAGTPVEPLARRIWAAHEKFSAFQYTPERNVPPAEGPRAFPQEGAREGAFERGVAAALEDIVSGAYEKIVLARALELHTAEAFQPLACLHRLRNRYSTCTSFSVSNETPYSFIGATPEILASVEGGILHTEALAGSAPRGHSAAEDAGHARALLASEKDRREHRLVVDSVRRRLEGLGLDVQTAGQPSLLSLSNVHHLRTPVTAALREGQHLLDVVEALHPTPAVGGSPREAVLARIAELEGFERGLYAGTLGWFDARGNGRFVVALRSALVGPDRLTAYAGAGIVAGSDPVTEREETDFKFRALLEALL